VEHRDVDQLVAAIDAQHERRDVALARAHRQIDVIVGSGPAQRLVGQHHEEVGGLAVEEAFDLRRNGVRERHSRAVEGKRAGGLTGIDRSCAKRAHENTRHQDCCSRRSNHGKPPVKGTAGL
jgi:hypothetical protein